MPPVSVTMYVNNILDDDNDEDKDSDDADADEDAAYYYYYYPNAYEGHIRCLLPFVLFVNLKNYLMNTHLKI